MKPKSYFSKTVLVFALTLPSCAHGMDLVWRVTDILSGDTGVISSGNSRSLYFHLSGCEVFAPGDKYGDQAKAFLMSRVNNQLVSVFFPNQKITDLNEKLPQHNLVEMKLNKNDVCSQLVELGLADYRKADESNLRAITAATLKILQQRARSKGLGMWTGSSNGHYASTPAAMLELKQYKYKQVYVNGQADPSNENFNRPSAYRAPAEEPHSKATADWRKPIGRKNEK